MREGEKCCREGEAVEAVREHRCPCEIVVFPELVKQRVVEPVVVTGAI
jgi:hypothetical protein